MRTLKMIFIMSILSIGICHGKCELTVAPERIEVGDIWQGESIQVAVKVTNTGSHAVTLTKTRVSCSCINSEISETKLEPDGEVVLNVTIRRDKIGRFRENILLIAKDKRCKPKVVVVMGKVRQTYILGGGWKKKEEKKDKLSGISYTPFSLFNLPDVKDTKGELFLTIQGLRPEDPFLDGGSVKVQSSLFKLTKAQTYAVLHGRLRCGLSLRFRKELEPGLYRDVIEIKLGEDVRLVEKLTFRVLGDVWPEKSTVNFGAVRPSRPKTNYVTLHFQSSKKVWEQVEVFETEPAAYQNAISIVEKSRKNQSIQVNLKLDPTKLPVDLENADSFFYFTLLLGDRNTGTKASIKDNHEIIKLYVYGMFIY